MQQEGANSTLSNMFVRTNDFVQQPNLASNRIEKMYPS